MGADPDFHLDTDALFTEGQAADYVQLAPGTLRNDRVTGSLGIPYVKLSGSKRGPVRYRKRDLIEWIKARTYLNTRQSREMKHGDVTDVAQEDPATAEGK